MTIRSLHLAKGLILPLDAATEFHNLSIRLVDPVKFDV